MTALSFKRFEAPKQEQISKHRIVAQWFKGRPSWYRSLNPVQPGFSIFQLACCDHRVSLLAGTRRFVLWAPSLLLRYLARTRADLGWPRCTEIAQTRLFVQDAPFTWAALSL